MEKGSAVTYPTNMHLTHIRIVTTFVFLSLRQLPSITCVNLLYQSQASTTS